MEVRFHADQQRARAVAWVLWVTLALNWLVAAAKILIGLLSARTTVLADGFHSLLDGANNVVALVVIRLAARPPDEDHPYGHRKFENLAAMVIGGVVVLLAWETLRLVFSSLYHGLATPHQNPVGTTVDWIFVGIIGTALLVNLGVAAYERRQGKRLGSALLLADAQHTRSDAVVTGMGLLSLIFAARAWWIDPLLALGVVGFLLHAAWGILDDNITAFTERQRLEPDDVREVAQQVEGVRNAHAIRSHGTVNDIHLDLHVVVDSDISAAQTAAIENSVGQALRDRFPNVTHISIHHQTEDHDPHEPVWKDA